MVYRIGLFSTGRDEAARILLKEIHDSKDKLGVKISYLFSNRGLGENDESDEFLRMAEDFEIPTVTFSSKDYHPSLRGDRPEKWRDLYHGEVMRKLRRYRKHEPKIDVAIGYMLIVSDEMAKSYRILNLHPALPDGPKGTWQDVVWELMEKRAEETGTMMHRLTKELDRGPAVTYCRVPIAGPAFDDLWKKYADERKSKSFKKIQNGFPADGENYPQKSHPLFRAIRKHQFKTEVPLLLHTIGEFANGSIRFEGDTLVSEDGRPIEGGYDITHLVRK